MHIQTQQWTSQPKLMMFISLDNFCLLILFYLHHPGEQTLWNVRSHAQIAGSCNWLFSSNNYTVNVNSKYQELTNWNIYLQLKKSLLTFHIIIHKQNGSALHGNNKLHCTLVNSTWYHLPSSASCRAVDDTDQATMIFNCKMFLIGKTNNYVLGKVQSYHLHATWPHLSGCRSQTKTGISLIKAHIGFTCHN